MSGRENVVGKNERVAFVV